MCTVSAVEAIAPEFVGDVRVQPFIDSAMACHDPEYWGNCYCPAIAFYVAHCLTVLPGSGDPAAGLSGGPITSVTTGGMSVGYASPASDISGEDQQYLSTIYGRKYLSIRSTRVSTSPMFVTL